MARVQVDGWRVAYAHILPIEELEKQGLRGLSYEQREEMWRELLPGVKGSYN